MKRLLAIAFSLMALAGLADAYTVSDVSARQRWPWNGLVDVDFTIGGASVADLFKVEVEATCDGGTTKLYARTYLNEPLRGPGYNRITWDLAADYPELKVDDLQVAVTVTPLSRAQTDSQSVYMVIDLSSGPNATRYPVRYTTTAPTLVPTNDLVACAADPNRTTKLWLKRVSERTQPFNSYDTGKAGLFKVHLSAYYIGLFEVSQKQWNLVMGTWPSRFTNETYRAARPVEMIKHSDILGHDNWPDSKTVGENSFVGRVRARTGLSTFNLPTEAQWECACRAGNVGSTSTMGARYNIPSSRYNSYNYNEGPDDGTALVGSYTANAWGFYDFYGNVKELCLDSYVGDSALKSYYMAMYPDQDITSESEPVPDPIGPPHVADGQTRNHVGRGGAWDNSGGYCNNWKWEGLANSNSSRVGARFAVSPDWQ